MSCHLKMFHHHDRHQMSYMQRIGCRVYPDISRSLAFRQQFFRSGHDIMNHTSPFQFVNKIHVR